LARGYPAFNNKNNNKRLFVLSSKIIQKVKVDSGNITFFSVQSQQSGLGRANDLQEYKYHHRIQWLLPTTDSAITKQGLS